MNEMQLTESQSYSSRQQLLYMYVGFLIFRIHNVRGEKRFNVDNI